MGHEIIILDRGDTIHKGFKKDEVIVFPLMLLCHEALQLTRASPPFLHRSIKHFTILSITLGFTYNDSFLHFTGSIRL